MGCSNALPVVAITGVVTLDGEAVDGATVVFRASPDGRNAVGVTDSQGRFRVVTPGAQSNGLVEGDYKIAIKKIVDMDARGNIVKPSTDVSLIGEILSGPMVETEPKSLLPKKYDDPETSGLSATIIRRGTKHFIFDLEGE